MRKLDASAREPHYFDHLAPVWRAVPEQRRGTFWIHGSLKDRAKAAQVDATVGRPSGRKDRLTLVSSWLDLKATRLAGGLAIMMEHGAGQTYLGLPEHVGSYIGSPDRDAVVLALVPGETAAKHHKAAHASIDVAVVGCPKLDQWAGAQPSSPQPLAAISHHWNCELIPETRSGWRFFRPGWKALAEEMPGAIGHAHPRLWLHVKDAMRRDGLEIVQDFDQVLKRASVYAVDNSSTLFEFAALGRPVVVLNDPRYRRDVHHGGRFWDWADIGVQVNHPDSLVAAFQRALEDDDKIKARREEIVAEVYGAPVGQATQAAVSAINAVL